jgi:osmotically-inducible protein OsmY
MKAKWASAVLAGALIALPMASYAEQAGASGAAGKETAKEQVGDAWITTKIKGEFAKDKLVSATKIHVDTDKGVVKLSGQAKNKAEVDRAMSLAKNVKGVVDVRNDVQIGATGATGSSGASGMTGSTGSSRH